MPDPENQLHAARSSAKHGGFHHDKGCSNAFGDNPMRVLVPLLEFNPCSAALRLFKVEADINGILPAERAPAIYFVSSLSRLRSALWEVTGFCV